MKSYLEVGIFEVVMDLVNFFIYLKHFFINNFPYSISTYIELLFADDNTIFKIIDKEKDLTELQANLNNYNCRKIENIMKLR